MKLILITLVIMATMYGSEASRNRQMKPHHRKQPLAPTHRPTAQPEYEMQPEEPESYEMEEPHAQEMQPEQPQGYDKPAHTSRPHHRQTTGPQNYGQAPQSYEKPTQAPRPQYNQRPKQHHRQTPRPQNYGQASEMPAQPSY